MKKFWNILIIKPLTQLTFKETSLRMLYRFLSVATILVLLFISVIILSSCTPDKYDNHLIYPEDTTIYGVVKSISAEKVKKLEYFFYSRTNNIIIQSDTFTYSVYLNNLNFNIDDSVKVVIRRVKIEGEFNDILTTIYPHFGEPVETYSKFTNLYYKNSK